MGTAMKHHVPYRVKPSFVIFDITLTLSNERPSARLNPVWHRMLYKMRPYGNSGHQRVKTLPLNEAAVRFWISLIFC